MSTYTTLTFLKVRWAASDTDIDVSGDTLVDLCVRLTVQERYAGKYGEEAEAHLNADQAEIVGKALLEAARTLRAAPGYPDPARAVETIELMGWIPDNAA